MSEVINYANNRLQCFCQVKLDSGERVLISICNLPTPSIKLVRLNRLGLWPKETIWEHSADKAGGVDAYVNDIMCVLQPDPDEVKHPLDLFRDRLIGMSSAEEVKGWLELAQKRMGAPAPEVLDSSDDEKLQSMFSTIDKMSLEANEFIRKVHEQIDEYNSLDNEGRAWVDWFFNLPEAHKQLVERFVDKGIKLTPETLPRVLAKLSTKGK